ncbi:MAG: KpsF/GutQ family sugar-phosphate isomerase [Acetatifactor sp.]|nr:KpsF/GutQ family sugar-phosphate isomerase [Acetatifactor sp.]
MDKLLEGKRVFDLEIEALQKTRDSLDFTFVDILDLITCCSGKVIMIGMGKPGHIAAKVAATFASLGTPAFHLNPAEAMHGDLGMISANDVVMVISYSGESDEIISILPNIKLIGACIVAVTGNANSTLAKYADVVQVLPSFTEACYLGLAPSSSTTAALCYGDALAIVASGIYGFKDVDFGKFHPAGALGKKIILRVDDIMAKGSENAVIENDVNLKEVIIELSKKGLGIVSVVNKQGLLEGVITDGDLRRQLEKGVDVYKLQVQDIMSRKPITIETDRLAIEALNLMKEKNISCIPVIKNGVAIGTVRMQSIISVGIVG